MNILTIKKRVVMNVNEFFLKFARPLLILTLLIWASSLFLQSCYALLVFIPIGGVVAFALLWLVISWIFLLLFFPKITILKILICGFIAKLSLIISVLPLIGLQGTINLDFSSNNIIAFFIMFMLITLESLLVYFLFRKNHEPIWKIVITVLLSNILWGSIGLFQDSGGCKYFTKFYSKSQQAYFEQLQAEHEGRALPEGSDHAEMIENAGEDKIKRTIVTRTPEGKIEKKEIIEVVE